MKFKKTISLFLSISIFFVAVSLSILKVGATSSDELAITGTENGYSKTINGSNITIIISKSGTYTVTGKASSGTIIINSGIGANITLDNVTIQGINASDDNSFPAIYNCGNTTINLTGSSKLTGGDKRAGIEVPGGATLTINGGTDGTGILEAKGAGGGAGIGGRYYINIGERKSDSGTVNINSGTITANGSDDRILGGGGAGIGGGACGSCGSVTVSGGIITAKGGQKGAGIGGGSKLNIADGSSYGGNGGSVTVTGGLINATGGETGVGIGGGTSIDTGVGGNGTNLDVSGGTVNANGGSIIGSSSGGYVLASGIGAGFDQDGKVYGTPGHYYFHGGSIKAKGTFGWSDSGKDIDSFVYSKPKMYIDYGLPVEKLYLATIKIPNITTPTKLTSMSVYVKANGNNETYRGNGTWTDSDGYLYLYLPVNSDVNYPTEADIIVNNIYYNGNAEDYKPFYGTVDNTGTSKLKINQCLYFNNKRWYYNNWKSVSYGDNISTSFSGSTSTPNLLYKSKNDSGASYNSSSAPSAIGDYMVTLSSAGDDSYYPLNLVTYLSIQKIDISKYTITLDKNNAIYAYTGNAVEPGFTVSDGVKTLSSSDFSVSYSNNTNVALSTDVASPKVIATGIGNYTGTVSIPFTIANGPSIKVTADTINWGTIQRIGIEKQAGSYGIASIILNVGSSVIDLTGLSGDDYISVTRNGTYKFTITDTAGLTASQTLVFNNLDDVTPSIYVSNDGNLTNYSQSEKLELNITTGLSGVKNIIVTSPDSETVTLTPDSADQEVFNFTADKNTTYTFTVTSNAGKTAKTTVTLSNIDNTKPSLNVVTDNGYESGAWTNNDVTFTLSNTAQNKGTTSYEYTTNNGDSWQSVTGNTYKVSSEGITDIKFRAKSQSGVTGDLLAYTIKLDKTVLSAGEIIPNTSSPAQSVILVLNPTVGASGIKSVIVSKSTSPKDTLPTILTPVSDNPLRYEYTADENAEYTFTITNNMGVTTSASYTVENIDKIKPLLNISSDKNYQSGSWTSDNVTITLTNTAQNIGTTIYKCSLNNGESWQQLEGNNYSVTEDGIKNIIFCAVSQSGITGDEKTFTVKLDKTAPGALKIDFSSVPFKTVSHFNKFGLFFNEAVNVIISAVDNLSGVEHYEYQLVNEGGNIDEKDWKIGNPTILLEFKGTVYARAVDYMGNISETVSKAFITDKTAPVINSETSLNTTESNASIPVSVSDYGSGIGTISYKIDGGLLQEFDLDSELQTEPVYEHSFTINSLPDGEYDVIINTQDNSGNNAQTVVVHVVKKTAVDPHYGDLNGDGKITAADALKALQASVGKIKLTDEEKKAADVDGKNNGVNASDALLILQMSVKKITVFPVEGK